MPTSTNAIYQAAARLWKPWLQREALSTLSRGEEVRDAAPDLPASSSCTHPACCFCRRLLLPAGEAWPAPGQPQHHPLLQPRQSHQQHDRPGRAVPVAAGHPGGVGQEQGEGPVPRHHGTTAPRSWFLQRLVVTQLLLLLPLSAHRRSTSSATCQWATCPSPGTSPPSGSSTTRDWWPSAGSTATSSPDISTATPTATASWCCWMSKVEKRRSIFNLLVFVNFPPDFIFSSVLQANPSILCLCLRR